MNSWNWFFLAVGFFLRPIVLSVGIFSFLVALFSVTAIFCSEDKIGDMRAGLLVFLGGMLYALFFL